MAGINLDRNRGGSREKGKGLAINSQALILVENSGIEPLTS